MQHSYCSDPCRIFAQVPPCSIYLEFLRSCLSILQWRHLLKVAQWSSTLASLNPISLCNRLQVAPPLHQLRRVGNWAGIISFYARQYRVTCLPIGWRCWLVTPNYTSCSGFIKLRLNYAILRQTLWGTGLFHQPPVADVTLTEQLPVN